MSGILIISGVAIGVLATQRVRSDLNDERNKQQDGSLRQEVGQPGSVASCASKPGLVGFRWVID